LMVSGLADTRPLTTNNTPEGRARNRRIEVVIDGAY
jgi:chemotaxis protein MotB